MRVLSLLAVASVLAGCAQGPPAETSSGPAADGDGTEAFEALRIVTDAGTILAILYPDAAPQTVSLMQDYAREGYYEGRGFYRIVPGHVIQVTDAAGGATEDARRVPLEASPDHHFSAGALGIARGEDPSSGGPEFFVMDFATSHLDGNFTVWGQVVEGLDVVHRIARGPAVDFRQLVSPLPPEAQGAAPTDRMATDPVSIRSIELTDATVPEGVYPLRVAKNVRTGEFRHSLEWPRSLAPGAEARLTWYMRPYNATAPPAPAEVRIHADGASIAPHGEATPGIYHFTWAPATELPADLTLFAGGRPLATLTVTP